MYAIDKLDALLRAYDRGGAKAFEEELMAEYTVIKAGNLILTICRIYSENGVERAVRAVRHFALNAKTHLQMMTAGK